MQIAIDGPSGAGKSSLAQALARRLGIRYIDTGAMYRALGNRALAEDVNLDDEAALSALLMKMDIRLHWDGEGKQHVMADGRDVSEDIRRPEVSSAASRIASHGAVRAAMVAEQQALANQEDVVMDGRDIGSVVLPNADIKFFVTADVDTRAVRRIDQMKKKDPDGVYDVRRVADELAARDEADSKRAVTPLVCVADAIVVDTSSDSLEESVNTMLAAMEKRGLKMETAAGTAFAAESAGKTDVATAQEAIPPKKAEKAATGSREIETELDDQDRVKMGWFFRILWVLVRGFCRLFFLVKITGEEHVKDNRGGCIVVGNHASYKDPVLLGICVHQKLRFMAKEELFRNPILAWLITRLGAFPITRQGHDTAGVRKAISVVKEGTALMLFPEGKRNKTDTLLPFEKGVAFIAQNAKAQVIPAYISPRRIRGRYRVNIGRAMDVAELASGVSKKERLDAITHMLEEAVAALKREQEGNMRQKK